MFDFQEKRKIRSWLYSKVSIAVILVITIWLSTGVFNRFQVEREMAEKRGEKEEELKALEARANALDDRVDHLLDDRGIEEELRNRFDVAKVGEQVVIIVDDEDADTENLESLGQPPGNAKSDEGWSFWDIFKFW